METNPLVPRQRNRRTDRAPAADEQFPAQQAPPQIPVQPVQPVCPAQQTYQQAPVQPVQPVRPVQQMYQQAPVPPVQPVRPVQQMYQQAPVPPVQPVRPVQQMYQQAPVPPVQPVRPVQQTQYTARPRVLNQSEGSSSGWVQPVIRQTSEIPHARAGRGLARDTARAEKAARKEAEAQARKDAREKAEWEAEKARRAEGKKETEKPVRKKFPGWMSTAVSLSIILVMALFAAYWLMQAYLTTQENERTAAYEAVLANYHITKQADGTLKVTWQDYIEKYAAQYNLQPAFVAAIIRNESSFRTNAESSVGARGLMQLMPDTAEWIAGKLDDHTYQYDNMWEAEDNIRYGCWYLGYLTRLFRGDPVLVSAAYHAGQTTVTQWLSDPERSADGITLDLDGLPDGPTKQYIGRVTQTYGIYQTLLYPDEAFGAAGTLPADGNASAAAER